MANMHKTMRGKSIDMDRLLNQNELTIAVGNAKVNARGDKLGPGGKIIRQNNVQPVPDQIKTRTPIDTAPPVTQSVSQQTKQTQPVSKSIPPKSSHKPAIIQPVTPEEQPVNIFETNTTSE